MSNVKHNIWVDGLFDDAVEVAKKDSPYWVMLQRDVILIDLF